KRHMMARIFTDENEPMFRMAKPLPLGPIPAATFAGFIRDRFAATEQQIADDAVDRILAITGCHPGDTQELAYFTWSLAATERVTAAVELVDRALVQVIEAENTRYAELWSRLSAHQRLVLTALISSGGASVYSEAYRRRHRLGPASSVQRSMKALLESDLVEDTPAGEYRVSDAFLRAWLARTIAASTSATYSRTVPASAVIAYDDGSVQKAQPPK
ncbi:MAG: ATP-binding protein, partial [Chloroflexota bacterium]